MNERTKNILFMNEVCNHLNAEVDNLIEAVTLLCAQKI